MRKTALLSTNEPEKIIDQCRKLVNLGWRLIATRETVAVMRKENIPVEDVQDFTGVGYEYGIPPTLHPKIEQALTEDCEDAIDLVFDVPYPLTQGNDVGGRTLLGLGAKGRRLVVNNFSDLERVVELLEQNSPLLEDIREELMAKSNFEIAGHYLALTKQHSEKYDGLLGQHKAARKEGENPYQVPCDLFTFDAEEPMGIAQFTQLSGELPCFTNTADMDSIIITIEKLKQAFLLNYKKLPYIVVAAKHGNPCGVGVDWESKDKATDKALWGNPQAIWGGEVITNFDIDNKLAQMLFKSPERERLYGSADWMSDVIITPGFSDGALSILGKRKQCKLLSNPAIGEVLLPVDKWHYRFVSGGFLREPPADYILKLDDLNWTDSVPNDTDSLLIAWATSYTSFHGGNEVAIAKDSMLLGVGGGPSTVMAAQHAVQWARSCNHETKDAVFGADAFSPFTDAPEVLVSAGCTGGIVPAGGKNHDMVYKYFKDNSIRVGFIPEQYRGFCRH